MGTVSPNLLTVWRRSPERRGISKDSMTGLRGAHSHNATAALPKENGHAVASTVQPNFPHPSTCNTPDDTPLSSTSELTQTWVHLAKTFVLIFPIYALGYFEFSFSWLLIGLVIFFWWRRNTRGKHSRVCRAFAFFEQEERSVTQSLTTSDLPPWVRPWWFIIAHTISLCAMRRLSVVLLWSTFLSFQEKSISWQAQEEQ